MKSFLLFIFLTAPLSLWADDFKDQLKADLGSCYDIDIKMKSCTRAACVKSYPEIQGAWYTIIIKGISNNNKCYTVSYAFLNDKIVSDAEHCWYDNATQEQATQILHRWSNAGSAIDARNAENDFTKLKYNVCKYVPQENK